MWGELTASSTEVGAPRRDAGQALEDLFQAEYAGLCRIAALLVGDRSRAEELVMDAFAATLTHWDRVRDSQAGPAYLRQAVVNRCRSAQTRGWRERRANARAASRTPGVVHNPESHNHVGEAVRSLPPRQRAAVVLTYFADLPVAEVAAALGCSPGTVKSQLSKARATLARLLAEEDADG